MGSQETQLRSNVVQLRHEVKAKSRVDPDAHDWQLVMLQVKQALERVEQLMQNKFVASAKYPEEHEIQFVELH